MNNIIKTILKKTFLYRVYREKKEVQRKQRLKEMSMLLQKDGPKILQAFSSALNEAGIKFWIDYGTLLGYYRDHDFIGHDNDLDSGAFIEDTDRVKDVLEKRGFRLVRYYRTEDGDGIEHCYAFEDSSMTIDVFFYKKEDESVKCICYYPLKNYPVEKHLFEEIPFTCYTVTSPFKGLKKVVFKDSEVYIPVNTDEYLKANYGDNYMTPDPNYNASSSTNLHWYKYEEKPAVGYLEIPY